MILYEVLLPKLNPDFKKIAKKSFFYFLAFDWLTFDYWDVSGISELEK